MELKLEAALGASMSWYAIHVMSRHERKVAAKLKIHGFEIFLPEYQTRSLRKDRVKMILKPLFPGYLFVHTCLAPDDKLTILQTPSVVRLVGVDNKPIAVPNDQLDSVRLLLCSAVDAKPEQSMAPGQKILVTEGPLKGVVGIVEKTRRGNRIIVSVDLLNRAVSASIGIASVRPFLDP